MERGQLSPMASLHKMRESVINQSWVDIINWSISVTNKLARSVIIKYVSQWFTGWLLFILINISNLISSLLDIEIRRRPVDFLKPDWRSGFL